MRALPISLFALPDPGGQVQFEQPVIGQYMIFEKKEKILSRKSKNHLRVNIGS